MVKNPLTNPKEYDIIKVQKRKELIEMLELLCRIPDHIGWAIVGALSMLTAIMGVKVGQLIYTAIRDRLADDAECEE